MRPLTGGLKKNTAAAEDEEATDMLKGEPHTGKGRQPGKANDLSFSQQPISFKEELKFR